VHAGELPVLMLKKVSLSLGTVHNQPYCALVVHLSIDFAKFRDLEDH
jgi:hypothetical protein